MFSYPTGASSISVGILGDGLSTGVAAHPALTYDYNELWKVMSGERSITPLSHPLLDSFDVKDKPLPPQVLWSGLREFDGESNWVLSHLTRGFAKLFLDTPQYSWGYLVARKLGADPSHIYVAAEEGAKVANFTRQVDRLIDHLGGKTPELIFAFFSGNDLCAGNMRGVTMSEDFGDSILKGLQYIARNATPSEAGTRVYLPHFLSLTQLLTKPSIINHEVMAHGEKMTCHNLRMQGFQPSSPVTIQDLPFEGLYLSTLLPPNPAVNCPTLFSQSLIAERELGFFTQFNPEKKKKEVEKIVTDYVSEIANHIRNYRRHTSDAVRKATDWVRANYPNKNITFHVLEGTGRLEFEGQDIASNCQHLSLEGQTKIAQAVLDELRAGFSLAPHGDTYKLYQSSN